MFLQSGGAPSTQISASMRKHISSGYRIGVQQSQNVYAEIIHPSPHLKDAPCEILWEYMDFLFLYRNMLLFKLVTSCLVLPLLEKKKWASMAKDTYIYKFMPYSYFSWVKIASCSVCLLGRLYSYVKWWTPPKPSQMRQLRRGQSVVSKKEKEQLSWEHWGYMGLL